MLSSEQSTLIAESLWFVSWVFSRLKQHHRSVRRYAQDCFQAGHLALVEAAMRFDPAMGCKLHTYASAAVIGEMLECSNFGQRLIRVPKNARKSSHLKCAFPFTDVRERIPEPVADHSGFALVGDRDEIELAVRCLRPRERLVVGWYYLDGQTMQLIADRLSISDARVSQIIQKAMEKLLLQPLARTGKERNGRAD